MPGIGEVMALSCALCWATAVMLFRRVGRVDPQAMNIYKNVVAAALLVLTMAVRGIAFDLDRSGEDWIRLVGSAALGLSIADTFFFMGLQRVGASVAAVADCVYSPVVIALSMVWLGESMRGGLAVGAPLVVLGLGVVAWEPRGGRGDRLDRMGLLYCLLGVSTTAVAVVIAKPALNRSDVIEATTVRLIAGTVLLVGWGGARGTLATGLSLLRPQPAWRAMLPATVVGTYLSMLLWLGGIKHTEASRAALLNQMGSVFALLFAAWAGERIPRRRWIGAALALAGAVAVIVGG